eukprot:scaffold632575_cov23-Prasinocladus_malaysianus.AAC.1
MGGTVGECGSSSLAIPPKAGTLPALSSCNRCSASAFQYLSVVQTPTPARERTSPHSCCQADCDWTSQSCLGTGSGRPVRLRGNHDTSRP